MIGTKSYKLFDSHFHIIEEGFPLIVNQGFLPNSFSAEDYKKRMVNYDLTGGVIVSGSFQGLDQTYLTSALKKMGPTYVGVTQLQASVSDEEIVSLNNAGVRGVRFNLARGGSEGIENLESFALRIHEVASWHTELYVDSSELDAMFPILVSLPKVSIAHLGLSRKGFTTLLKLVEKGIKVKATGFYRVDFEVGRALQEIATVNPEALFFGTDLPSTRASRPYSDNDFKLVSEVLGAHVAQKVFHDNAVQFYQPSTCG